MRERIKVGLVRTGILIFCIAFWVVAVAIGIHSCDGASAIQSTTSQPSHTAQPAPTSQPAVRVIKMKVMAYCPCEKCCGKWALRQAQGKRTTATGDDAFVCDGVAADFKLLPKRTLLEIPGVGIKEVDDTGGAMRKSARQNPPVYHLDLRMANHRDALNWGVKWLDVKVLPKNERRVNA